MERSARNVAFPDEAKVIAGVRGHIMTKDTTVAWCRCKSDLGLLGMSDSLLGAMIGPAH